MGNKNAKCQLLLLSLPVQAGLLQKNSLYRIHKIPFCTLWLLLFLLYLFMLKKEKSFCRRFRRILVVVILLFLLLLLFIPSYSKLFAYINMSCVTELIQLTVFS